MESFQVKWSKNPISGPTTAKLRLDYSAKFKKDATHDPALAEFRQNAFHTFEVTAGPHKGQKHDNPALRYVAIYTLEQITGEKPYLPYFDQAGHGESRTRAIEVWRRWYQKSL